MFLTRVNNEKRGSVMNQILISIGLPDNVPWILPGIINLAHLELMGFRTRYRKKWCFDALNILS